MNQIIKIAWDLNENTENRYQLVYEIAELAKKLVDENQLRKVKDEYNFDEVPFDNSIKKETCKRGSPPLIVTPPMRHNIIFIF